MYIAPNTTIRLIRNCPLDKSNQDTIYFSSVQQQTTFFINTLEGVTLQNNSYQRVNKGVMRVAINAEQLYNCNYLAFQNASFGNKWFYAFINKIEYVNNTTSEIYYTIDVLQTWHFDYVLMQCFVEREHSVTDNIGDNIVEEKLATGEYITDDYSEPEDLERSSAWDAVLFCTVKENYDNVYGFWDPLSGLGSGLYPVTFPATQQGFNDLTSWVAGLPIFKTEAIVCAYLMPHKLFTTGAFGHTVTRKTTMMRSDGTAVKNKKCLIYPYNFLYVTNYQGKSANYRYEFFNVDQQYPNLIAFDIFGGAIPAPGLALVPSGYKGMDSNLDESLELTGFPQLAWNIDSFKAWIAQNASSVSILGMAGAFTVGSAIENAVGGGAGVFNLGGAASAGGGLQLMGTIAAINTVVQGIAHAAMPPQSRGNYSGQAQYASNMFTFGFANKHITPEYATIIDDYFTMFGYATNKVKAPNRTARPEWNYVKTIGCKIDQNYPSGLPADDAEEIEKIYNNGIRFWMNPAHIGNYSYDNSPRV